MPLPNLSFAVSLPPSHLQISIEASSKPLILIKPNEHTVIVSLTFFSELKGRQNRSMDFERYFAQGWKSVSSAAADSESFSGGFDCNICFDCAHEPVVTLCGHLYCWPCIYKWLHVQSTSLASDEHPQCPVCKADISHTTMVPLYGRGQGSDEAEGKTPYRGMIIPPRPSACGARGVMLNTSNTSQRLPYRNPYQSYNYNTNPYGSFEEVPPSPLVNLGDPMMQEPVVGVLREMVYARVFGAFPNTYHSMGTTNPRMRRHEMLADKSLNRISIFLFCCFLLCLVVF
ncbi:hypothetical protein DKX38_005553 [Salix brachista]|uniref:E3 ubiquitin-protein ligase RMA n=1 Tax=Salix brachista TaxID=2182728 RepID=A0A5N5N311_9ROSI|nr:hypothetical protein DKX38_005553 [Salix brachista]